MAYSADEIRDFADDATERRLALKAIPEPMGEDDIGYWVEWCKSDDAKLINSPRIVHFFARALARAEAAEAESARLREALKPFADLGREFGNGAMQDCIWSDDMKIEGVHAYNNGTDYHITLGDLRRAGAALYAPCVHQLRRMT